jgi:hypothetical protein
VRPASVSACRKPSKKAALVSSERMADEMRCADPFRGERRARRLDQRLEARVLAERRQTVAGQIDRQRRARLGQQAMHGPPPVEVGAEAMQEHDRGALAPLQPQAMNARRGKLSNRATLIDVAQLDATAGAGAVQALKP